jgi:hypothetical protein
MNRKEGKKEERESSLREGIRKWTHITAAKSGENRSNGS